MGRRVIIDVDLRKHQFAAWHSLSRFNVVVWHRRAGKTFFAVSRLLVRAMSHHLPNYRAYYIAPTFSQAKRLAWDYLQRFCRDIPGAVANQAELRVDLPNGSRIQLLGGEQYDNLRGQYADDVVLDEAAMIPPAAWKMVILPMLSDRLGCALIMGTPMGRHNLFYQLWDMAGSMMADGNTDWHRTLMTCYDTGAIEAEEIERIKGMVSPQEFGQEFLCSWSGALPGAIYATEMDKAEQDGRIVRVMQDKTRQTTLALDLGWNDTSSCVWGQEVAGQLRILEGRDYERTSIPDMVADWKATGLPFDNLILPHDARVKEIGTGLSRLEVFQSLLPGTAISICPNISLQEGIEQVRQALGMAVFDLEGTSVLREALCFYHRGYDEKGQVRKLTPVHDWSSHRCDGFRYWVVGRPNATGWGARRAVRTGLS